MTARLGLVAAALLLCGACGVSGLNFLADDRVEITSPEDRAEVRLPLEITWTAHDIGDGSFGVYVDRAPQPPGQPQTWIARGDNTCRPPSCPDDAYLATHNVFSTTETRFTIDRLPVPTGNAAERRDRHEVTIVLLDADGARIGESAFFVEFDVVRARD